MVGQVESIAIVDGQRQHVDTREIDKDISRWVRTGNHAAVEQGGVVPANAKHDAATGAYDIIDPDRRRKGFIGAGDFEGRYYVFSISSDQGDSQY